MAESASQAPPSLAEQYALPKEDKVETVSKIEEVAKDTVSAVAEVATPEKSEEAPAAVEESSEPTAATEASSEKSDEPPSAETGETTVQEEEASEETPEIKLETAPADFRFPTTNQTRHCFTRYIEYHRCVAAKGEGAPECDKFAKYYRSLCPGEWVDKWNEQRENGTFPGPL